MRLEPVGDLLRPPSALPSAHFLRLSDLSFFFRLSLFFRSMDTWGGTKGETPFTRQDFSPVISLQTGFDICRVFVRFHA
jgi:hypothetical protein